MKQRSSLLCHCQHHGGRAVYGSVQSDEHRFQEVLENYVVACLVILHYEKADGVTEKRLLVAFMPKRTNLMDNLVTPSLRKEETCQSRSIHLNTLPRQRTECTKVKA